MALEMALELDHVFICTSQGAPAARELLRFGLREGRPNQHPGQGTANRRFAFRNAMLELLWVSDEKEARGDETRPTLLWERWSGRDGTASPFGICLRPRDPRNNLPPFRAWEYRPAYLTPPLGMHVGEAGVEEPMWVYLGFSSRAQRERHFREHPAGIREITGLLLTCPVPLRSNASEAAIDAKVLAVRIGPNPLLEIEFDAAGRQKTKDFRPHLPLIFRF